MRTTAILAAVHLLGATVAAAGADATPEPLPPPVNSTLRVSNRVRGTLATTMYSTFFETEINFGGEGGLYAEMVRNRDFEALGRGVLSAEDDADEEWAAEAERRAAMDKNELRAYVAAQEPLAPGLDPLEPPAVPTDFRPWYNLTNTTGVAIDPTDAPFPQNPHSLAVTASSPGDGVGNPGYWGMNVRAGMSYKLSVYAKSANTGSVTFALRCPGVASAAAVSVVNVTGAWALTEVTMQVGVRRGGCVDGYLAVTLPHAGTVLLDHVSVFPGDAALGLFRKDLFDYLKAFAPPMVRLPGGCYMEGSGLRTRWQWKKSIGPRQQRSGHYNSIWRYWVTDGFGLTEMLRLTEAIGAAPLIAIYTGYSPWSNYVPLNESAPFAQDAVDIIEYCNGGAATKWGARRVSDGLPAPVGLDRLEVGNEEQIQGKAGYGGHYKLITGNIWDSYPDMDVVASGTLAIQGHPNRSTSCFPCVGGCGMEPQRCDSWDEHTYLPPLGMANLSTVYDTYNVDPSFCETTTGGKCPQLNVLEYASRDKAHGWKMDMEAAAGDAVFLFGMERNSRYVRATAYAPLFANVRCTLWKVNLINFNSSASFANPSYYLQTMLKANLGDYTLDTAAEGEVEGNIWNATASVTAAGGLAVKVANFGNASVTVEVSFDGFGGSGTEVTLHSEADVLRSASGLAANSLDEPRNVTNGRTSVPPTDHKTWKLAMEPFSVYVLHASTDPSNVLNSYVV